MALTIDDLAILKRFEFTTQPVGIKYLSRAPEGQKKLDETLTLCEMLKRVQGGEAFYAGAENHACDAGLYVLGQTEIEEQYINGEFGAGLGAFCDPRAAARVYHYIPRIEKGVTRYIFLSPLDKLAFDPDLLIFLANTTQTEIILRAMSYKTGRMWISRYSSAIGCAWLFVHPYLNGEINFISTGLGFGMRRRKLFPEGLHFISVPFDQIHPLLQTLEEMPWVPEPYKPNGLEYVKQLCRRLGLK
jgi:uncharacterized protein (DUF169 family)